MKKYLHILSILFFALIFTNCKSQDDKAKEKIAANRVEFIQLLRSTGRPGVEEVISHLDSTDFFTMGAGGHHTEEGGLVQHSLEVYRIMRSVAWFQKSDSIVIVALFHDMGKIDHTGWHPWRSVRHLAGWGFELTSKEYHAIFFHHKVGWRFYRRALRRALTFADLVSSGWWKLWHKSPKVVPD